MINDTTANIIGLAKILIKIINETIKISSMIKIVLIYVNGLIINVIIDAINNGINNKG